VLRVDPREEETVMKRMSNGVVSLALSIAVLTCASACNFKAGVAEGDMGAAGTTGVAGTTGTAGTLGPTGAAGNNNPFTGAGGSSVFPSKPCEGLQCAQSTCRGDKCTTVCQGGARTTVSGTIYDPAGNVPLYNIAVYVPNKALDPIADGPTCDMCDPITGTSRLSGAPVTLAKSGTDGSFKLGGADNLWGDVPAGTDIPLVIQVGKWRREVKIPSVTPCVDNALDKELSRLPKNSSEGHIPKMAITTGAADALQCLLLKVGVEEGEFTTDKGPGRVHLFAGGVPTLNGQGVATNLGSSTFANAAIAGGTTMTPVNPWWDSFDNLAKYDIILHSCEGGAGDYNLAQRDADIAAARPMVRGEPQSVKSMAARLALEQFANKGGRVFASHWHTYWFADGPPSFKSIGTFGRREGLPNPYLATIDQGFPTGQALAEWLVKVGGSTMLGSVEIAQNASNTLIDAATGPKASQRWIYADTLTPKSVQFLSATTPIPGGTCGRAVLSDLHVTAGTNNNMMMTGDDPRAPFPTSCVTKTLEPREKVLEFMLFDIASCVKPVIE
jgi:hypothetical protein